MEILSTKDIQQKEKIHVCLYGSPKTGKTKLIETLPGRTLVLNSDKGLLTLKGSKDIDFVNIGDFNSMIEAMKFVQSDKCDYDNVVIDSLSVVADYLLEHLEKKGVKGFDLWAAYEKYIKGIITTLRDSARFNSVSIFELVEKENENGLLTKKVGLQGKLASRVGYFYDLFLATRVKHAKDGSVYKIQTRTADGYECGSRIEGLETYIDPDLGKLFKQVREL